MILTLYKIGVKTYFRNSTSLFWSFGFVLIWIFIYAYAFPYPAKSSIYGVESSYLSFILLFGISIVSTSVIFYTVSTNLSSPYIIRFDSPKSHEIGISTVLSSITFGLSVAIFSIISSLLIFLFRFGSIKIEKPLFLIIVVILISAFYITLGILMSYIFTLLKQVKALKFASEIPMILIFIFVLALQIFRIPEKNLIYVSPFNEEFTLSLYSLLGNGVISYYPFTVNIYYVFLFLILWIICIIIITLILERIYEKSDIRGQYSLEDVFR